ncbi:hypothetical protein CU097_006119 [Rhizopus azygosporus]|uniref:Uncharacterized protein n=1 Tax=Rhizopus azygosporus TaxID=86630 RepID=A0A367K2W7_RHIAZ|nr:hypothetical protein CU097_006119 [Rhizopus azygosporus]
MSLKHFLKRPLSIYFEGKYLDISNIELKKHGKEQRVVKADGCKVFVEADSIINQMIKHHKLDFEKLLWTIASDNLQSSYFLTLFF